MPKDTAAAEEETEVCDEYEYEVFKAAQTIMSYCSLYYSSDCYGCMFCKDNYGKENCRIRNDIDHGAHSPWKNFELKKETVFRIS